MTKMSGNVKLIPLVLALGALASCSPLGLATGTGAALGIASAQEGGIRGAATDIKIKAQISDLWFKYDLETFAKLNLTVDQGRVLLTGVVQDPEDRVEAVRLAWQADGVKQVINEIKVADSEGLPGFLSDKWISTRLRTEMTFDSEIQSINYSVDTVQGVVYLMGVAESQAELDRVLQKARTIPNVKQVVSYVKMAGENVQAPEPGAAPSADMAPPDMSSSSMPLSGPSPSPAASQVMGAPMPGAPMPIAPMQAAPMQHSSPAGIESEVLPPP